MHAAEYALLSDGSHRVPFDEIVKAMKESGAALPASLRETSQGGLAKLYAQAAQTSSKW
jgi:L-serine dehydratase